jgi:putative ABC transport system ATP-binding protein
MTERKEDLVMDYILKTSGLKKYYGKGDTLVKALDGVNLEIEQGSFTAIVGTSGSGKSTLLNMLGGLDTPSKGSVKIGNTELDKLNSEQATIFRRRQIGFIFQNYNLIPVLTVWENIVFPLSLDGQKPDQDFIMKIVKLLGLESKLDNLPNNLSGGQQQRVAIARALASKPSIILADEPTGNLDSKTSDDVVGLLKMTSREFHQTIVMITHNPEIAQMADRIVQLEDGRIVLPQ